LFSVIERPKQRKRSSIARSDGSCSSSGAGDGFFREVVDGRAEAARRDHAVRAPARVAQHRLQTRGVVADGVLRIDVDADLGERARDVRAVGIEPGAEQQLGADRDDLNARHQRALRKKS